MSRVDTGSCLDLLPALPAGCARLVFADPPFNIGYRYDAYDDRQDRDAYLEFARKWVAECVRVLAPDGSMWVAIGDDFAAEHRLILDAAGLFRRSWVIWHYTFGVYCPTKWGRDHTHLLYYTRDPKRFVFDADAVKVPSARQAKYGDKRAAAGGRVPGDVWTFPRVCGTFRERNKAGHTCQMPEAVLERIVRACSAPGDLVLDPFAGSGTSLAVAKRLGRRWYGCELSENYAAGVRERLAAVTEGDGT